MNTITKGDKKNVILERRKPKTPQKENLNEVDGRDTFQTPNYATEIILPYLSNLARVNMRINTVWECAAGQKKISTRLEEEGFEVISTDLAYEIPFNFLTGFMGLMFDVIVTNPPFSLKRKFYEKCKEYGVPFALLIPADYSGWIISAVKDDGAEKIIPSRRIDYITPNVLNRIWEGETFEMINKIGNNEEGLTLEQYKESLPLSWGLALSNNEHLLFKSIYKAPAKLLRKYSSSYYHSMWLTWGFGLGKTETFVELTNEMKDNI